jgi:hypothetical protein
MFLSIEAARAASATSEGDRVQMTRVKGSRPRRSWKSSIAILGVAASIAGVVAPALQPAPASAARRDFCRIVSRAITAAADRNETDVAYWWCDIEREAGC